VVLFRYCYCCLGLLFLTDFTPLGEAAQQQQQQQQHLQIQVLLDATIRFTGTGHTGGATFGALNQMTHI
jgi:hypothetical protein